jgi:hypothetical protein
MIVRATEILKAIKKLNPAEKHRLREYLIDALTASSSTGALIGFGIWKTKVVQKLLR